MKQLNLSVRAGRVPFGQRLAEGPPAAISIAVLFLAGCSQTPAPEYSGARARPIVAIVAEKPVRSPQLPKPMGVPVTPKSLSFVQQGLHNCGTVAMLLSWAKLHPREAAAMVRRQRDATYAVQFADGNMVRVTAADLQQARRVQVVKCKANDRWPEIVLTAFTRLLNGSRSTPALDFAAIEWISASDIGTRLSGSTFNFFEIKPETQDKKGRVQVGAPVSTAVLDRQLRAMRGHPATAYTNRRVHIWAMLDYDAQRKHVYARNPRRSQGEWMTLNEFRQRFQLLVYAARSDSGGGVRS